MDPEDTPKFIKGGRKFQAYSSLKAKRRTQLQGRERITGLNAADVSRED
jgi:hypothetical protein